jgi:hypothetical protein
MANFFVPRPHTDSSEDRNVGQSSRNGLSSTVRVYKLLQRLDVDSGILFFTPAVMFPFERAVSRCGRRSRV